MHYKLNRKQVVHFSYKTSFDEEYAIFMLPEPVRELPANPLPGNNTIPKLKEYLNPIELAYQPFDNNHPELYSVLVSLFTCEPFYNFMKRFREKAEYSFDMKFFMLLSEFGDLLNVAKSDRKVSLNIVIGKIANLMTQTECIKIYDEILRTLNSEIVRVYYFNKTGWEIHGDKAFDVIGCKYPCYSPLSILLTTEIKRIARKKNVAEQIDHFVIKNNCIETELRQRLDRIDIKRPVKKYPIILVLSLSGTVNIRETISFGIKSYVFKSAILRNKNIENKAGVHDCVMAFYRLSKMDD